MEVINAKNLFDKETGLLFHALDPKNSRDEETIKQTFNSPSWSSDNIKRFLTPLSDEPLGTSLILGSRWGSMLYAIYDTKASEFEVVGTTMLVPNSPIIGRPELKKYFYENKANLNQPHTDPSILTLKQALRLLNEDSRGLYIHALGVASNKTADNYYSTEEKPHYGTKIFRLVAENCSKFNPESEPLCTMASISMLNNPSIRACSKAGFATTPDIAPNGYFSFYSMNEEAFTF